MFSFCSLEDLRSLLRAYSRMNSWFFCLSDGYWLRAQAAYDLEATRRNIGPALDRITPWEGAAVAQ